jgi:hypothetical protein
MLYVPLESDFPQPADGVAPHPSNGANVVITDKHQRMIFGSTVIALHNG